MADGNNGTQIPDGGGGGQGGGEGWPNMKWDGTMNVGNLIAALVLFIGGVGAYVDIARHNAQTEVRLTMLEQQMKERSVLSVRVAGLETQVAVIQATTAATNTSVARLETALLGRRSPSKE